MILRILRDRIRNSQKSVILIGPRQVGKSTLISSLKPDLTINLADELEYLNFSRNPGELRNLIALHRPRTIYIDEIQRLPSLLNTIQALIDGDKRLKFFLTGSSARKLKRGGANLLPGRLFDFALGPLCAAELNYEMNTRKVLEFGSLPEVYLCQSKSQCLKLLRSYSAIYLKEEIKSESLVRNLESFGRFLNECLTVTGRFVDYSKFAKNAKISRHSCPRYFEILEDTMIGNRVFSFSQCRSDLDLIKHPKFYFFDNGVYNGLLGNHTASQDRVGVLAEQMIFNQLLNSANAYDLPIEISTFRTRQGQEVDFIVKLNNKIFAIEVKSTDNLNSEDTIGLQFFDSSYPKNQGLFIFHLGQQEKKFGKIWSLPWQKGMQKLFQAA